ncbi:MAG: hypothetical protein ACWA5Q_01985 [bacterium]
MANPLSVYIDGTPIIQFDRNKTLTGIQRRSLDQMDQLMDQGINFDGAHIKDPSPLDRTRFVANKLINALLAENDALAAALCAWLGRRVPDLHRVIAVNDDQGMSIDLVTTGEPEQLLDGAAEQSTQEVRVSLDSLMKSSKPN